MKKFILLLCCLVFMGQASFGEVCNNIKQYNLKNGQTVIIKEQKDNPIVIIDTFVKTGSVNENDKNNGVAHFLEHLFFKGTTTHKRGEFEKILESKGGVFNAATSRDYTHYYIKIDSKHFNDAVALHSDMLLNIAIPQSELDMERKVVMEEISRSTDNPDNKVFDNFMKIIFNGTPYSRKILGTNEIIKNITRDEILAFHHKWYKPENMVTVVVGDVDTNKALNEISKNFSKKSAQANTSLEEPQPQNPAPITIKDRTIIEKADVNTAYLMLGYPSVGVNNLKEAYALDIAASVIAGGQNSDLYKTLKQDENLAIAIGAGNYELKNTGVFYVDATFTPNNYDKIVEKIKQEIASVKSLPIEQERIDLIKNAVKRQYVYANESVSSISNMLGYDVAVGNGICDYTNYLKIIDEITPDFIQKTLNKYLKDENLAISVVLPKSASKLSQNANIKNISLKKTTSAKLISTYKDTKKFSLKNGATLLFRKNKNNDVVAVKIFIKGGSLAETKDGTADILSATIKKGTKHKSAKEIEDALDNIGTSIKVSNGAEYFEVTMKTTKNDFKPAFELLKEILEEPAFTQKDIAAAKSDALNNIKGIKDSPYSIAFENFDDEFYKNSPYHKSGKVLEKTIPTITSDDVKALHQRIFSPRNMIISVAGNTNEQELADAFSLLSNTELQASIEDSVLKAKLPSVESNVVVKESKNSKAAWIIQGWKTNGLASKDFIALKLISMYLGGGFTSKLFVNLREEKGLAYEVGASSSSSFNQGVFLMYIGTNPQNTEEVKAAFNTEIEKLKTEKISDSDLSDIKSMFLGKLKLSTETNMSKAYLNGYYEFFDKGYQFGYDYPELVQKVTADDIKDAANCIFSKPYIMSIVAEEKYLK
ncbi:MAG: insulinase family protein [bacterium]|nr:insulinase family protein [bacterium]